MTSLKKWAGVGVFLFGLLAGAAGSAQVAPEKFQENLKIETVNQAHEECRRALDEGYTMIKLHQTTADSVRVAQEVVEDEPSAAGEDAAPDAGPRAARMKIGQSQREPPNSAHTGVRKPKFLDAT